MCPAVPFTPSQGIATPSPTNMAAPLWYAHGQYKSHLYPQPGTPGQHYALVWGPVGPWLPATCSAALATRQHPTVPALRGCQASLGSAAWGPQAQGQPHRAHAGRETISRQLAQPCYGQDSSTAGPAAGKRGRQPQPHPDVLLCRTTSTSMRSSTRAARRAAGPAAAMAPTWPPTAHQRTPTPPWPGWHPPPLRQCRHAPCRSCVACIECRASAVLLAPPSPPFCSPRAQATTCTLASCSCAAARLHASSQAGMAPLTDLRLLHSPTCTGGVCHHDGSQRPAPGGAAARPAGRHRRAHGRVPTSPAGHVYGSRAPAACAALPAALHGPRTALSSRQALCLVASVNPVPLQSEPELCLASRSVCCQYACCARCSRPAGSWTGAPAVRSLAPGLDGAALLQACSWQCHQHPALHTRHRPQHSTTTRSLWHRPAACPLWSLQAACPTLCDPAQPPAWTLRHACRILPALHLKCWR